MNEMIRHCCVCDKIAIIESRDDLSSSMAGWLVVTTIHENQHYECNTFCSIDCLQHWMNLHSSVIPEIFEMSFKEGE